MNIHIHISVPCELMTLWKRGHLSKANSRLSFCRWSFLIYLGRVKYFPYIYEYSYGLYRAFHLVLLYSMVCFGIHQIGFIKDTEYTQFHLPPLVHSTFTKCFQVCLWLNYWVMFIKREAVEISLALNLLLFSIYKRLLKLVTYSLY